MSIKALMKMFTCMIVITLPTIAIAQPGGDFGDPDAMVPIDGGLSLLLAAGVGYGVKKARAKHKS